MATANLDREEIRYVDRFFKSALAEYRQDTSNLTSLLYLVNIWPLVCDEDRGVVGKKILDLLNKEGVNAAILAREVLQYVGTPVCSCKAPEAWKAVKTFLSGEHLLSVNATALMAGVRLLRNGETKDSRTVIEGCEADVRRLSSSASPDVRDGASEFLLVLGGLV